MIALPDGAKELLKSGSSLSKCAQALSSNGSTVSLTPALFCHALLADAKGLQVGDVSSVELGHVRHVQPAAVQVAGADLHQAGHRHFFDFTKFAEVDFCNGWDARATASTRARRLFDLLQHGLDVNLHVFLEHPAVRAAGADCA